MPATGRGPAPTSGSNPTSSSSCTPCAPSPARTSAAAVGIAEALGGTYWLTGQVEEGYDRELGAILAAARCPLIHRGMVSRADIYAAADLVVFPSLWEGFGNPPIEAGIHRRPVVVGHYPVAEELRALGFRWLDPDDLTAIAEAVARPDPQMLDRNRELIEIHLSFEAMTRKLEALLVEAGWLP